MLPGTDERIVNLGEPFNFIDVTGHVFSEIYWSMILRRNMGSAAWIDIVYLEELSPVNNYSGYQETCLKRGLEAFVIKTKN